MRGWRKRPSATKREIEKGLAGVTSGYKGDSGVSDRLFGTFLTWLNDHETDVFVVCTANDIKSLPPEFARAERFDAVFFLDLPTKSDRDLIWAMYLRKFDLDATQERPDDEGWTGAEIRACCRIARMNRVSLVKSAKNVVPVSRSSAEQVEYRRMWANGRCLDADRGDHYRYEPGGRAANPTSELDDDDDASTKARPTNGKGAKIREVVRPHAKS